MSPMRPSATASETPSGFRIQKRKVGPKPIDACVALAMAAQRAISGQAGELVPFVIVTGH